MIDNYTTVHTKHRPDTGKPSAAKSMCTIILKVFKNKLYLPLTLFPFITLKPLMLPFMKATDTKTMVG